VLRLAKKSMTAFSVGLALTAAVLLTPSTMVAQEDAGQTPLGDVARSFRKKPSSSQTVIDNDNFSKLMDEAESHRLSVSSLLYSMNAGGKGFQVSAPDVTCSLSFSANASSLLSNPYVLKDLPPAELVKLDGPATIDGDSLQLSVYNGTEWNVHELTIGLSAGLLGLSIALTVIWIGVQAFLAAQIGLRFGTRLGEEARQRSEQVAGVALILVAAILLVLKLLRV